ncbi:hypothetical protein EJ05DRAFT_240797 [Pseudovirgaria hyperparasitica]|uniref:Nucleoporin NUP37 n=1 Tax=Pseudovirgaria hyperparasitica TaxID=470096 RepID=A0A6A6WEY3_9PEZI|nr:uncharacterized protein EJ05DRAFT_240797 [Pseudovirgaria hyperparasitica]KAF2760719.1 hypothetical protein EJ05DRAFT_240797 [Pseudovirgaria hyperparasitica]
MKPTVFKKGKTALLSYELPHRVHTAQIYPKKAPNGSTIIIYGHTSGVRILWRGGRRLKQSSETSKTNQRQAKTNGTQGDAIAVENDIVDDNNRVAEARRLEAFEDAEFESDEEELDAQSPVPSIIQHVDLAIPSEVLHIAIPGLPSAGTSVTKDQVPQILHDRVVFTVASVDSSIRVISLPISPPSNARKAAAKSSKTASKWGEEMAVIHGQYGHAQIPGGVAMTWTPRHSLLGGSRSDVDMLDIDEAIAPRSARQKVEWDLIIASHSADVSGILQIFRLPLASGQGKRVLPESAPPIFPCQTRYLPSPAVCVAFSPNTFPATRHMQLLVADSKGCIKVYDPFRTPLDSKRVVRAEELLTPEQSISRLGEWVASFNTGFEVPKTGSINAPATAQRKRILDAKWATGGRSIITLLADGEWGVWDIDHTGSNASRTSATKRVDNTTFAIGGFLVAVSGSEVVAGSQKPRSSRALAPMTPNTRRTREENLFQDHSIPIGPVARGGISVASLVSASGGVPEDSVVIRYGTYVCRISNLAQFWARSASGSSGSLHGPGLSRVEGIDTRGEYINGIQQFDVPAAKARPASPRDLLVVAEHRLLILTENTNTHERGRILFAREAEHDEIIVQEEMDIDQKLLEGGQLNLDGIDNMLDGMASGATTAPTGRRVGFAT